MTLRDSIIFAAICVLVATAVCFIKPGHDLAGYLSNGNPAVFIHDRNVQSDGSDAQ